MRTHNGIIFPNPGATLVQILNEAFDIKKAEYPILNDVHVSTEKLDTGNKQVIVEPSGSTYVMQGFHKEQFYDVYIFALTYAEAESLANLTEAILTASQGAHGVEYFDIEMGVTPLNYEGREEARWLSVSCLMVSKPFSL